MKKIVFILALILFSEFAFSQTAGDTIVVPTLNFNMIIPRRGTYHFPDTSQSFRKILMQYTLKCDPRTTQDKYNCGEWDYLTYNMVYKHLGIWDSTQKTWPLYRTGSTAPDTIPFTDRVPVSKYISQTITKKIKSVTTEINKELVYPIKELATNSGPVRYQFVIPKTQMSDLGYSKGNISKISLNIKKPCKVKNLQIRMKNKLNTNLNTFENTGFYSLFSGDYEFKTAGWNDIVLTTPYNWTGGNTTVDISYFADESAPALLMVSDSVLCIRSNALNGYLQFDGVNDYIDCGQLPDLSNAQKFTFECQIKLDTWENSNHIIGLSNKVHFELGSNQGDLIFTMRNPDNTYGRTTGALMPGDYWTHLAAVYDASQARNEDKLKIFVNGEPRVVAYSGDIPNKTPATLYNFFINSTEYGSASAKCGIDEVRVWKDALSDSIIKNWFAGKLTPSHPNYNSLLLYFPFDKNDSVFAKDASPDKLQFAMCGYPKWKYILPEDLDAGQILDKNCPAIKLGIGTYVIQSDTAVVTTDVPESPISVAKYKIVNHIPLIDSITYINKPGFYYTYDLNGKKIDSAYYAPKGFIYNSKISYYDQPFELTDEYEIGRYITPYGINLDLGPSGFTWYYDVTDYEPLLHGDVDFAAGNQQELIDVKFLFIKGTPPRKVLKIDKPWGNMRSMSYANLSADKDLSAVNIPLLPNAAQFMLKTRFTGHGHNSNNGQYPHCCEWKDNTHYLLSSPDTVGIWHVFTFDCAVNPVFPQGGTWPGAREGWCPGDVVKDYDFEVTPFVRNNSVNLDYDLTKVPQDNLGMGGGNYVVGMQLFQYGAPAHSVDAEIYDVITPNNNPYYSRLNPMCAAPTVIVRNNGSDTIKSLNFSYKVSGGTSQAYSWKGIMAPNTKDTIPLPVQTDMFWIGDGQNKFTVEISNPNGMQDQYSANDAMTTQFTMPDLYKNPIEIWYQTNKRPQDYIYTIYDITGKEVVSKTGLGAEKLNIDKLNLPRGCYTFELIDPNMMGLSYWAYTDQGSGSVQIHETSTGKVLKSFNSDFGYSIRYSFGYGDAFYVGDPNYSSMMSIGPNPVNDKLNIRFFTDMGESNLCLTDISGNVQLSRKIEVRAGSDYQINTSTLASGTYLIRISNMDYTMEKKFVKLR